MQKRFEALYRGLLILLALALFWVVWGPARAAAPAPAVTPAPEAATPAGTVTNGAVAVITGATNAPGGTETNGLALKFNLVPTIDRQYLTFGLDQIPWLRDTRIVGIALWQYIASFVFIFLAFYVSKFLDYVTRIWLRRWAERTQTRSDDLLLELAHGPVKIIAFVILLHIGLSVFQWPPTVERWLSNASKIVVAVSITYALLKLIDILVGAWKGRTEAADDQHFDRQLVPILRKALKALVAIVATLVTLDNVGVNITGLVASLSIGGLALGLAAQDTVANLFGAVAVLVDKPFKIGDRVQFEGVDGTVETIGLRSTRVRNADGHLITVPNKTMGNATITNITERPHIRTVTNIGLTYDTSPEKIRRAATLLEDIFRAHPQTHDVWVCFNKFGDFALNLQVLHWWSGADNRAHLTAMQELNLEIKRRFDEEQIEMAFPTQTLHFKPIASA